jgi:hypothetical protein
MFMFCLNEYEPMLFLCFTCPIVPVSLVKYKRRQMSKQSLFEEKSNTRSRQHTRLLAMSEYLQNETAHAHFSDLDNRGS